MKKYRIITTREEEIFLDESVIREFGDRLRGTLFMPGDHGYDDSRNIHNGMIENKPGMIVRCAGAAGISMAKEWIGRNEEVTLLEGGGFSVDPGIHNLYVAGSATFPTGGVANPTLTLVAMALRLSDHLKTLV